MTAWKNLGLARRSLLKLLILAGSVAVCVLAWRSLPLREYLWNVQRVKIALHDSGSWGPLIFMVASSVLIAIGVGRLIFCGLGGATFGFVQGFFYAQVATLAGSYISFLYARWIGRELVKTRFRNYERLNQLFKARPFVSMIFLRQLPIGGIVLNLILGLTTMGHVTFLIGSAIGFAPEAIIFTMLGTGIVESDVHQSVWQISLALFFFIFCLWGMWKMHKGSILNRELEAEAEQLNKTAGTGP